MALADKAFDLNQFKENASDAFTMIRIGPLPKGDRDTLKDLCSDNVYDAFDNAITERENKGEKVSTEIHAVRKTDVVSRLALNINVTRISAFDLQPTKLM